MTSVFIVILGPLSEPVGVPERGAAGDLSYRVPADSVAVLHQSGLRPAVCSPSQGRPRQRHLEAPTPCR